MVSRDLWKPTPTDQNGTATPGEDRGKRSRSVQHLYMRAFMMLSLDRQSNEMLLLRGEAQLVPGRAPVLPGRLVELDADIGLVYAVQGRPRTPVKIGYTRADCLRERVASLQTGNPYRLRVLASAPGYRSHEQRAHAALLHVKCYNEWFHCSPELHAFVIGLKRGNVEEAIAAAKLKRGPTP